MRIVSLAGMLALCSTLAGCGSNVTDREPAPAAVAAMRDEFLHAEVIEWFKGDVTRAALGEVLRAKGLKSDGTQRQGGQEVEGYSTAVASSSSGGRAIGVTVIHAPGTDRVVGVYVLALSRNGQEAAKKLIDYSLDSVDASAAGMGSGRLHFLGATRLGPQKLLKMMLRVDRPSNDVYSVMYAVSAE